MELLKVEVEVAKEAYELGQGVASLIGAIRAAVADGWQTGQDLPLIVAASVGQIAALQGAEKMGDEAKENPEAFAKALALGVADAVKAARG